MGDYTACGAGVLPMQTIATALAKNQSISKQDRIRERELFRFYRPNGLRSESSAQHTPLSSPPQSLEPDSTPPISNGDVTLAALTQLVALRLGAHRSMINVIGRETQYTLVDSTKTIDLNNQITSEADGDGAWVGAGGSMHKRHSICESVVTLPANHEPFLIVPDLRLHPEFKTRSYVQGAPHYRFYAGTSLRSTRGVVIGALCLFGHEPRKGLSQIDKEFLSIIADTVMRYLEMKRAAAEKDKVTMMSRGLNAFVEGSSSQFAAKFESKELRDSMLNSPLSPDESKRYQMPNSKIVEFKLDDGSKAETTHTPSADVGGDEMPAMPGSFSTDIAGDTTSDQTQPHIALEQQIQGTLARAGGLLHECLSLRDGSGVVFYDPVTRLNTPSDSGSSSNSPYDTTSDDWSRFSDGGVTPGAFDGVIDSADAKAPVLASTTSPRFDQETVGGSFRNLTARMLGKFIKRYSNGKTWEFDEHGIIPHDEHLGRPSSAERDAHESALLTSLFPGVRSLIFMPLWDANVGRHYSGCFVWTTDAMSRFSSDIEFSFVTAFSNSISAEISRLATIDADQRKSDFIGSISHELRSPLHGIIASCEFLLGSPLNSFQHSLVMTVETCARTLLDTINHVLDFSKINSLKRALKKPPKHDASRAGKLSKEELQAFQSSGIMSIMGSTDFAAITEEVVDSIYAGKTYAKGYSPTDMTEMNAGELTGPVSGLHPKPRPQVTSDVQMLLDIEPGDYHFVTQPGAIRRIIMNIFGNALKYTDKGSIVVKLHQEGIEGSQHPEHHHKVVLTVRDTGKGISSSYLKTRLYTPFAQENDLAPGTGLGLSIVRTIVTMLKGEISIVSAKGKGTEVKITFPNMSRPNEGLEPGQTEPPKTTLEDFKYLSSVTKGVVVGLYGFVTSHGHMARDTEDIIRKYLRDYCRTRCITHWDTSPCPDAIIVDEELLEQLENNSSVSRSANIIVLCRNPVPIQSSNGSSSDYHFLLKPFGPYKLARSVRKCIDKSKRRSMLDGQLIPAPGTDLEPPVRFGNTENAQLAGSTSEAAGRAGRPRLASISTDPRLPTRATFAKATETGLVPASETGIQAAHAATSSPENSVPQPSNGAQAAMVEARRPPRILVVDDNSTNRILLRTFLSKRGLASDEAQDGSLAVNAAVKNDYDIIFMDISMPVMNGFEATREIRKHEDMLRRKQRTGSMSSTGTSKFQSAATTTDAMDFMPTGPAITPMHTDLSEPEPVRLVTPPVSHGVDEAGATNVDQSHVQPELKAALIIALTGLASGRDQSEAFTSGVDLYMTKPVSFKEVGRLIDTWMTNGGLLSSDE